MKPIEQWTGGGRFHIPLKSGRSFFRLGIFPPTEPGDPPPARDYTLVELSENCEVELGDLGPLGEKLIEIHRQIAFPQHVKAASETHKKRARIEVYARELANMTCDEFKIALAHPAFHSGCAVCQKFERYYRVKETIIAWEQSKKL